MKPLKLSLSNFRGIKEGLGLGDIDIDFTKNNSGLIALCGDNGSGKTSFIDNLQPFREMPSRGGSFYDHVTGDAKKEFVFEMDGNTYRSLILIEPKLKKMEAYLYVKNNGDWSPLNDGKTTTYDEHVEKLIGSQRLFFTSIFRAQGAKPISANSKSELKELFTELLMLDKYQNMSDNAKEHKKQHETEVEGTRLTIENLNAQVEGLKAKESEKKELTSRLDIVKKNIAEKEAALKSLHKDLSSLESKKAVQEKEAKRIEELKSEVSQIERRIEVSNDDLTSKTEQIEKRLGEQQDKIARAEKILSGRDKINEKLREEKELESKKGSVKGEYNKAQGDIDRTEGKVEELNKLRSETASLESKVESEKEAHAREISLMEKEIERAKQTAEKLDTVPCKDMDISLKCPLIEDAVLARDDIDKKKNNLAKLKSDEWLPPSLEKLKAVRLQCTYLQGIEVEYKKAKQALADFEKQVNQIDERLVETRKFTILAPELELSEKIIQEAKREKERLEMDKANLRTDTEKQVAKLKEDMESKREETGKILASLDSELSDKIEDCNSRLRDATDELSNLNGSQVKTASNLGMVEQSIKSICQAREKVEALKDETKLLNKEVSEWGLLERALGKDGLIALEIDDAGPAISAAANELLQACFGPRFTVKIETTRPTRDGKKMMEVFDIKVLDAESDEEKTIVDLSGGEKVWVQSAITQAISIRNKELSERNFLTCFEDEIDGALSEDNKARFFAMKKKAMELGGFEQTIFISQDPEVWKRADSRIVFERGNGIKVE